MTSTLINVAETFGLTEDQTLAGVSPITRRQYTPRRRGAIVEAATLWRRVFEGDIRAAVQVREALSTSDLFVSATGDVLDRELLQQYTNIQAEWAGFATRTLVRNFKPKKMVDILGGRTALDRVPELTAYPGAESDTREFEIQVAKFGRQFGFSWEAMVNDDLDELMQIPNRFAEAASITETNAALEQIADLTTGAPNTGFFKDYSAVSGYGDLNTAPVAGVLNEANLQTAIEAVRQRKDAEGNIVPAPRLKLVVGPAQEFTARRILNATELRVTSGSRTSVEPNPLRGTVDLEVVNRLPGLAWFVLPTPNQGRPAIAVAFLRGFETPDIRQKANAGQARQPDEGDFDDDSVRYRVRHVTGAAQVDPIHTYAGTGSA